MRHMVDCNPRVQAPAHGEGLAEGVADDAVARNVDHIRRQARVRTLQQQRPHRCLRTTKSPSVDFSSSSAHTAACTSNTPPLSTDHPLAQP
jgi:hypothetical protein